MEYVSNSLKTRKGIEAQDEPKAIPEDRPKLNLGDIAGVEVKKKSTLRKFKDGFIESDWSDVKESLIFDYLLPAAKSTIVDCFQSAIEMLFYGTTGRPLKSTSRGKFTPYNSMFDRNPLNKVSGSNKMRKERTLSGYSMYEIICADRMKAQRVLAALDRQLAEYGMVSVADLYDNASDDDNDIQYQSNITDHKYGWYDINNYSIRPIRGGYYSITLPDPVPLDL